MVLMEGVAMGCHCGSDPYWLSGAMVGDRVNQVAGVLDTGWREMLNNF